MMSDTDMVGVKGLEGPVSERVRALQPESDLVPLALIALEVGEPVDRIAHRFADSVVLDDVGMRAVTASAAREFFTERAIQKARYEEAARRRREQRSEPVPVPVGVPAQEGLSPFESMAAAGGVVSPTEEFGRPAPNFLDEELAAGQQAQAQRREKARRASEKRKS